MDLIEYVEWSDGQEISRNPLLDPYIKMGFDAHRNGLPKYPNPFKKQDYKHGLWKRGWNLSQSRKKS